VVVFAGSYFFSSSLPPAPNKLVEVPPPSAVPAPNVDYDDNEAGLESPPNIFFYSSTFFSSVGLGAWPKSDPVVDC
jgi:hypothetical protein